MIKNKPVLNQLNRKKAKLKPIWLMRQAGRYLPEYQKIRKNCNNFLELCYSPQKAAEVTIQPIKRFNFDAAIIFSDILVIPDALGIDVKFKDGIGPLLSPTQNKKDIEKLRFNKNKLDPVYEAIDRVKTSLNEDKTLIGFAGAPWTLATYMVEGKASRELISIKKWAYQNEDSFSKLIEILSNAIVKHCINQINAGVEVIQLFDSWSGTLTPEQFTKWVTKPTKNIIQQIKQKHDNIPIIGFPRNAGLKYKEYCENTGIDAVSVDQYTCLDWITKNTNTVIQGNLDPIILLSDKENIIKHSRKILEKVEDKNFIFNLGHGIHKTTPIENVMTLVETVRNYK